MAIGEHEEATGAERLRETIEMLETIVRDRGVLGALTVSEHAAAHRGRRRISRWR